MKRIFIFHGWRENPQSAFFPWLKEELQKFGYEVVVPLLPHADNPNVEEWTKSIEEVLRGQNKDTAIIAHSLGGTAVLKCLEKINGSFQIEKTILIAPAINKVLNLPESVLEMAKPWIELTFDENKIKKSTKEIFGFFSDDDQRVPLVTEKVLREKFGAKTYVEHGKGHYAQAGQGPDIEVLKRIFLL